MKILWKVLRFILIILVGLEIFLQFYNPFTSRLKHGKIILPRNVKYEIETDKVNGLDAKIIHSKNSIGFRGEELNDKVTTKIVFMGGSTTECFYLSDNKDWPNLLGSKLKTADSGIWVNNAGMDGHSTFGNLAMLKEYVLGLKPDYIILMCGLNDIGIKAPNSFDKPGKGPVRKFYDFLEIPATIINISRAGKAKKSGLNHIFLDNLKNVDTLNLTDAEILTQLKENQVLLPAYKTRVEEFAKLCKDNGIRLILVSQAILFSEENDVFTDASLENLKTGETNGKAKSLLMKMYNKASFEVSETMNIPFINLSARLPRDSRFFYDGYHFTNEGSEMIADILYDEINSRNLIKKQ